MFRHAPDSSHPLAGLWEIEGVLVKETDRSRLIGWRGREIWVPRRVSRVCVHGRDGRVVIGVPSWFARREGLL